MTSRVTPTLALCLAGGLAAGIALARPGDALAPAPAPAVPAAAETLAETDAYGEVPGAAEVPAAAAAPAGAQVQIADFAFGAPAQIGAGGELVVTNADGAPHTLTAIDGSFDTGTIDGGGAVAMVAPTAAGTYEFFCAIHPSMTGQLVVS
jgi:plastocyanin